MKQPFSKFASALLFVLAAPHRAAIADIFQWQYVNPANPSQGKQQSTTLCIDGAGANATTGGYLAGLNLTKAYLTGKDLSGTLAQGTNLTSAELSQTNLTHANFDPFYQLIANLSGANLSQANLTGASFYVANLTGANL